MNKQPNDDYIEQLGYKYLSFDTIKDKIDTLVLGSSHAQLGYRAKEKEFNFGLSFQDLYYSYKLYEKLNNHNLKNVILFYSVFSPGNQTIRTSFADKTSVFKIITDIDYQNKIIAIKKFLFF